MWAASTADGQHAWQACSSTAQHSSTHRASVWSTHAGVASAGDDSSEDERVQVDPHDERDSVTWSRRPRGPAVGPPCSAAPWLASMPGSMSDREQARKTASRRPSTPHAPS